MNKTVDTTFQESKTWGNAEYLDEGLVLTDCICNVPEVKHPQRMNFIIMALCCQGEAHYSIDTHERSVKAGDLLFISERHILDNYRATTDFKCKSIIVTTEFYHSFVLNAKNVSSLLLFSMKNPVVSLTDEEIQVFSAHYKTIREKMGNREHHFRVPLIKALLLAMFYDMSNVIWRVEQRDSKSKNRANAIFSEFIHLLEDNFRHERRVSWYAEQIHITPKYLSEVVKDISLRTTNDWIDSYVVLELRVMLHTTTKTIKQICDEMHFPNQSFLGKYFKEHVGVSPSEYRSGKANAKKA